MASAKETPRQKLIGMMYLVLLALLALQVSSAIMEKFKFLDDSLQHANDLAEKGNEQLNTRIETAVSQAGNKQADLVILQKAKKVKEQADKVKAHIKSLRESLIASSGGFENPQDRNSMYAGAKDEGPVEELMITKRKADELKTQVNSYSSELRTITGLATAFPSIALDAQEDPRIGKHSEQKQKKFSELNFAQTPMVAAMAVLSNMESEVLKQEAQALDFLAGKVDAQSIHLDQVMAMYKAESNTVVAGTKYKANVFLGASSSALTPTIEVDGQKLDVSKEGVGNLEVTARGGNYDAFGFAKRKWSGKITFKNKGRDTTFTVSGEYKVAKPFIDVQSATPPQLYKNCGNALKISCPPLGADFKPSYQGSTGGDFLTDNEPGKVTIVPQLPNVKLKVASNGNPLDEKNFSVRLIPLPTFKLKSGASEVNVKTGLPRHLPPQLCMEVVPDVSFQASNPRDARYKADVIEVSVIRRRKSIVPPKEFRGGCIDLGYLRNVELQEDDRLVIEVKKVLRANFRNELEEVNAKSLMNITIY